MICRQQKRVALHVRAKNSYSMIAKTIDLRWTKVPSFERPTWAKSREHCSEKSPRPNAQARSEQAVELTRRDKRAVKALDRKPRTARPRTQHKHAGVGEFLPAHLKILLRKQEVDRLLHRASPRVRPDFRRRTSAAMIPTCASSPDR